MVNESRQSRKINLNINQTPASRSRRVLILPTHALFNIFKTTTVLGRRHLSTPSKVRSEAKVNSACNQANSKDHRTRRLRNRCNPCSNNSNTSKCKRHSDQLMPKHLVVCNNLECSKLRDSRWHRNSIAKRHNDGNNFNKVKDSRRMVSPKRRLMVLVMRLRLLALFGGLMPMARKLWDASKSMVL